MNSKTDERARKRGRTALVFATHVLLATVLSVLSIVFKGPGPSLVSLLLQGLLIAQACLLAIWLALSCVKAWLRFAGIGVGMGGLLRISQAVNPIGFPIGEQLGLGFELFVLQSLGRSRVGHAY